MSAQVPSLSIRRFAIDALAAAIAAAVPQLAGAGKCVASYADEEETKPLTPSLRIIPKRIPFEPQQAVELQQLDNGDLVVQVGEFSGECVLMLATGSRGERELLEESLLGLWQLDTERPGVLVLLLVNAPAVCVGGPVATSYSAIATFLLEDDEWQEERVFTKKRDSEITLRVELPALVLTHSVPNVDTLQLVLAQLSKQQDVDAGDAASKVDSSQTSTIADDGSFTTILS